MRKLTREDVLAAVEGGSVYASGGGAFYAHGLEMGNAALSLGDVNLVSLDELSDDDIILTQTAIGAPGGTTDWQMTGRDYIRAVELVKEKYESKYNGKIVGLMTPQNGKSSSTNGWISAAALDLFIVDATGDIRAHPTGEMGDMGINSDLSYRTIQAAVGGKKETGRYTEVLVEGLSKHTSKILRTASDQSGGFIATARHPLTVKYIKENGVVGGLSTAIALGHEIIKSKKRGPKAVINKIVKKTQGEIIASGRVVEKNVNYTNEAFDIGTITVEDATSKKRVILHVQNEFMAIDDEAGNRLSTYPDVETVFKASTAFPLSTNEIEVGEEVVVFKIDKQFLPLSTGVKDPAVYPDVERALNISLYDHSFPNSLKEQHDD
ncbi:DUF917 domain-containing protein [Lactococcus insecticola]|uniref:DUF917 domain-containing protein n=1 Tax=Pseudolactococcus insecticola TaxID=2709158 RepID=A0A6A0B7Q3_9LACT|nr:DUF917 family protein [Lactococcus insecticola]GFH40384.1 hypothetical protein Hs20B_07820 [Lactococcus insecticola]